MCLSASLFIFSLALHADVMEKTQSNLVLSSHRARSNTNNRAHCDASPVASRTRSKSKDATDTASVSPTEADCASNARSYFRTGPSASTKNNDAGRVPQKFNSSQRTLTVNNGESTCFNDNSNQPSSFCSPQPHCNTV